ncbi:MAG: hypothetical protein ABII79_06550 [bacterium]
MKLMLGILGIAAFAAVSFTLFFLCGLIGRLAAAQSKRIGFVIIVLLLYGMLQLLTSDFHVIYLAAGFAAIASGYALGRFFWRGKARIDLLLWIGIAALLIDNSSSLGRHLDWKLVQDLKSAILLLVPAAVAYPIARIIRYRLMGFSARIFDGLVALGMSYVLVMLFVSSGSIYYFPWGFLSPGGMEPHLARIYVNWLSSIPALIVVLLLGVSLFLFLGHRRISKVFDERACTVAWMSSVAIYFATNPVLAAAREGAYVGLSIFLYVAIMMIGSIGYWSARRGISNLPDKWVHGERSQYVALLMFFLLFGLTVEAQTTFVGGIGGFPIPYFEVFVLLGTISLFWGVILGQRWQRCTGVGPGKTELQNEFRSGALRLETENAFGRVGEVLGALRTLVRCVEDVQEALNMRRATAAGILSATKGALEAKHGSPEAWRAVASDIAAIDGFVAALNTAGEALHALRVVRYREGSLPPEVASYLERCLSALRNARKDLPNAWKTAHQTRLVGSLPGIEQLVNITDLEARLCECERLAQVFLEKWRRFAG